MKKVPYNFRLTKQMDTLVKEKIEQLRVTKTEYLTCLIMQDLSKQRGK